jgi:hypothetical protein
MSTITSSSTSPKIASYALRGALLYIPISLVVLALETFRVSHLFVLLFQLIIPTWIMAGKFKDVEGRPPTLMETVKFTLLLYLLANAIGAVIAEGAFALQGTSLPATVTSWWHSVQALREPGIYFAISTALLIAQLLEIGLLFRFVEGSGSPVAADNLDRNTHDISL